MSEKLSRKELKAPDAFQKAGLEARSWFQERQRQVVLGAGLVLVICLGVALASYFSQRAELKASKALGAALEKVQRPVEPAAPETPPAPTPADEDPPFKSEKERDEAIKREMSEFRAKWGGTRSAASATLLLAQAEQRLGNYEPAASAFAEYIKSVPQEDAIRALALEGEGYAHEAKGNLDQALAAFDRLARENRSEFLQGMGLYHRARILVLQGKKEEAAKALGDIPSVAPGTSAARMALDRLAVLKGQGVNVPAPLPPPTMGQDGG